MIYSKKEIKDILLNNNKISENEKIIWGEYTITALTYRDSYRIEIDGGTTIIPELNNSYHCYNVNSHPTKKNVYIFEGPDDHGFESENVKWIPYSKDDNTKVQSLKVLPGNSFEVNTGFYGIITFKVISLRNFLNSNKPVEKEIINDVQNPTHIYSIAYCDDKSQHAIFIKTTDGNGVACVTVNGKLSRYNTWKKIFVEYYSNITLHTIADLLNFLTNDEKNPDNLIFYGSQIGENSGRDYEDARVFKEVSLDEFITNNYYIDVWTKAADKPVSNIGYLTWAQQIPKKFIVPCF